MRGLDRCLADAIRSESLDHGGSFLDNYVPSSSVSFVLCKNCTVRSMCFVGKSSFLKFRRRDRTKGAIFLSVSLSIKEEESEGYNGQNGCQSLQLKDSVLIQEAGGNKISVKENGSGAALYTTKHLWAGAFAAMVSRSLFLFFTFFFFYFDTRERFILDLYHNSSIVRKSTGVDFLVL